MKVFVTIGNSDGKLSHRRWQEFHTTTRQVLMDHCSKVIGEWRRDVSPYVNACFLFEILDGEVDGLRESLDDVRKAYDQDSIGMLVGEPELIGLES